jgi:hypothetical protein
MTHGVAMPLDTRSLALLAVALVLSSGCATSLSSGHSAQVLKKGQWEANAGMGVMVPLGVLGKAIDGGQAAAKAIAAKSAQSGQVKVDEETALAAAATAAVLVVSPPAPVNELTLRYGLLDGLDVGLRLSGPAIRGEVHGQVYDGPEWKVAAGVAVARHTFESPLLDLLDKFSLAQFHRTDVEFELLGGREWDFGAIYAGPKLVYSRFSSEGLLVHGDQISVENAGPASNVAIQFDLGHSLIYGGLLGGRVGWKYLFVTAELGVYGSSFAPMILGKARDLGGLIVFPMLGIVGRY